MSRRPIASISLAAALAAAAVVLSAHRQAPAQQPVFRSASDVITVPVGVRASGTPVSGLRPEDFAVTDNGVPQVVDALQGEAVPADITILAETSEAMKRYSESINEQVRRIAAMVRPTDRFEILGMGTYVDELVPLHFAADHVPIPALPAVGLASINDALVAALLREPDQERPHLVIALTDNVDTMSSTTMQTVREVAKHSEAILEIAWITLSVDPAAPPPEYISTWSTSAENERQHVRSLGSQRTQPRTRAWYPHYEPAPHRILAAFDPIKEAAETTGGAMHPPGVFTDRTAAAIFDKLYADYRHSYTLRYSARDVDRAGWHDIKVTIPKLPNAEIRAKRGYYVEK